MPEELLQRMRDIHYPDVPGWFPPAPGWWVLAGLLILVIGWLARLWRKRSLGRAPYAIALRLLERANAEQHAGTLTAREYLEESNQILKRLLIHVRHNSSAVSASGDIWLFELDRLHGSTDFSSGPGQVLGAGRYARKVTSEFVELHTLLVSLIETLRDSADTIPEHEATTNKQEELA